MHIGETMQRQSQNMAIYISQGERPQNEINPANNLILDFLLSRITRK